MENCTYENMPCIYKQCFIALRLTEYDGNANTVQELELMGISVVHNGTHNNSLKWKSLDDIMFHITIEFLKKCKKATKLIPNPLKSLIIISNHPKFNTLDNTKIRELLKNNQIIFWNWHDKNVDFKKIKTINKFDLCNYLFNYNNDIFINSLKCIFKPGYFELNILVHLNLYIFSL